MILRLEVGLHDLDVLPRHLLPQPCGFEGGVPVGPDLDPAHLTFAQRVDVGRSLSDRRAAGPAPPVMGREDEYAIPRASRLLDLESVVGSELPEPVPKPRPDRFLPVTISVIAGSPSARRSPCRMRITSSAYAFITAA